MIIGGSSTLGSRIRCSHPAETQSERLVSDGQFGSLRAKFPGIDIDEMEKQFVAWNKDNGSEPENYVAALFGFIKQKVKREG